MSIDWNAVATIASPLLALFVGVWVNRKFESRPQLITYFGHVSSFRATPTNGTPLHINTHSVVLRNNGRSSATNIRLHHATLPDFNIWPAVNHQVQTLPDGSKDILIPTLVPGEEITVSYLYFAPLIAANVNAGVKSDQGFANQITVLLQRQYPAWFNRIAATLFLIGAITIIYFLHVGLRHVLQ